MLINQREFTFELSRHVERERQQNKCIWLHKIYINIISSQIEFLIEHLSAEKWAFMRSKRELDAHEFHLNSIQLLLLSDKNRNEWKSGCYDDYFWHVEVLVPYQHFIYAQMIKTHVLISIMYIEECWFSLALVSYC